MNISDTLANWMEVKAYAILCALSKHSGLDGRVMPGCGALTLQAGFVQPIGCYSWHVTLRDTSVYFHLQINVLMPFFFICDALTIGLEAWIGRECSEPVSLFASAVNSSSFKLGSDDILMSSSQLWQALDGFCSLAAKQCRGFTGCSFDHIKKAQIKFSSEIFPHCSAMNFCLSKLQLTFVFLIIFYSVNICFSKTHHDLPFM